MASEFDLIRRYFTRPPRHTDLAVGDDGALLSPSPGCQLVVSTDMLVSGTHFFPDADPEALGWKTLAVNVSDLAAMGARTRWATLALALPSADEAWLAAFARGFLACADAFEVDLIGGDTTRGPLNLCPTLLGEVPRGTAILRSGARVGDELWVSGQPGRAVLALRMLRGELDLAPETSAECLAAMHRPQPRQALGLALRGIASAMLDVSDGLLGDLGHILEASHCGAELELAALPLDFLTAASGDREHALDAFLRGGDDYELLFTAPMASHARIDELSTTLALPLTRIGRIAAPGTLALRLPDGITRPLQARGFDHFAPPA